MSLKLTALTLFTFDASALPTLQNESFVNVAIPADIGDGQRRDGFLPVLSGHYVLPFEGGVLVRPGRASKSVNKALLKRYADTIRREGKLTEEADILNAAHIEVCKFMPQTETSFPILFDGNTGIALFGTSSVDQANKIFVYMQAIAPGLRLKPFVGPYLVDHMREWLIDSRPFPRGLSYGDSAEVIDTLTRKKPGIIRAGELTRAQRDIRTGDDEVVSIVLHWRDDFYSFKLAKGCAISRIQLTDRGASLLPRVKREKAKAANDTSEKIEFEDVPFDEWSQHEVSEYARDLLALFGPMCSVLVDAIKHSVDEEETA